ncbi:asparaginyl-tRNA synthetase isoform X2 [Bacillus rossius redtenbacheri]|uniref:asparaginyl-tRNA synthetase isoform X2 n=1 Tax=Bacillus rossius redtenbacheri TaxID=93214 RepID=UPI002FDE07FF
MAKWSVVGRAFCSRTLPLSGRVANILNSKRVGCHADVKGWVKAMRKMKDSVFIDLDDGSCAKTLQIVVPKSVQPPDLTYGASLRVQGTLQLNPSGQVEVVADGVEVCGPCVVSDGYPFLPRKRYSQDYARQFLHLRPRTKVFGCVLRVRDAVMRALHQHFHGQGYVNVHTPVLTSNDCEGAGEVFVARPDSDALVASMAKEGATPDEAFFNVKSYLTVSGQLHLEAVARSLCRVYTVGPTFRAENSRTRHHLAEFYMVEAEVAFLDSMSELLSIMENLIKDVTARVLDECEDDVQVLLGRDDAGQALNASQVVKQPFVTMTYKEAVSVLNEHSEHFEVHTREGEGLSKEHELFLVRHAGGIPVFVVEWPSASKPFYMKRAADNSDKVLAVDLLVPQVGELCGGSLREDDYVLLQDRLREQQLHNLQWYLDLRKYGNVPTGGFGMGLERYLQCLLGIRNIKDTIPFPRWPHNCSL